MTKQTIGIVDHHTLDDTLHGDHARIETEATAHHYVVTPFLAGVDKDYDDDQRISCNARVITFTLINMIISYHRSVSELVLNDEQPRDTS